MRFAELLIFCSMVFLIANPLFAQKAEVDSTIQAAEVEEPAAAKEIEEIPIAGVLNDQEIRSYRSDFFPINLAQRGRQAASAYRGMPPGFYRFEFAGNPLSNPVMGFWNEQWIPYYQIDRESSPFGSAKEIYQPPVPLSSKPLTRVVFSQDYVLNISFVDINFIQRLSPTNFVQLSGMNFIGTGSEGADFSQFQVNTYRGQLHWEWGKKWKTDLFFWHTRQAFNMVAEESADTDRFKQIGNILWILARGKLSEKDSLVFVPGFTGMEDRYARESDIQRHIRYKIAHGNLKYLRKLNSASSVGALLNGRYIANKGERYWAKHSESDGQAQGFLDLQSGGYNFRLHGGAYIHSESGAKGLASVAIEKKVGTRGSVGVAAFSRPQAVPLLWRTIYHDSIPRYPEDRLIQYQGVNALLKTYLSNSLWLQIEPFALRAQNYPYYLRAGNQWQTKTLESYGIRVLAEWNVWRLQLLNDFTYNNNYKESFAQQVNNITTAKISFPMFKNALRLDAVFTWRFVGYFELIDFQRLLNQYWLTDMETGPYYIGDFRVQAHFRNATAFFIWENLTSQNYYFVSNTLEALRIFRLGIDWILFD